MNKNQFLKIKSTTVILKSKIICLVTLVLFIAFLMLSCSKDDPKPLGPFNVVACTPTNKMDDLSIDTKIAVTFNKKPSAETIAGKYFTLEASGGDGTNLECDASFDGFNTIVYTPKVQLIEGTSYGIGIFYATAADGAILQRELMSSFTTKINPH
jgi:hypothetical protein